MPNSPKRSKARRHDLLQLLCMLLILGIAVLFLGGCSRCGGLGSEVHAGFSALNEDERAVFIEANARVLSGGGSGFGALEETQDTIRVFSLAPGEAQEFLVAQGFNWQTDGEGGSVLDMEYNSITAAVYEDPGEGLSIADAEPLDTASYTFVKPEGTVEGQPYHAWILFTWDGENLSAELRKLNEGSAASGSGAALSSSDALTPFSPTAGVDYDDDGNSYVVVSRPAEVKKYGPDGKLLKKWGSDGDGDGEFMRPMGIAVDRANGYVYVGDTDNARIQKFDTEGKFLDKWGEFGEGERQFNKPLDLAWNPADNSLFVSDYDPAEWGGNKVVKQLLFDEEGNLEDVRIYDLGTITGDFVNPGGISVSPDGAFFFVTNLMQGFMGKSYKISIPEGALLDSFGAHEEQKYPADILYVPGAEGEGAVAGVTPESIFISYINSPYPAYGDGVWKTEIRKFVPGEDVDSKGLASAAYVSDPEFVSPENGDGWKGDPAEAPSGIPEGKILLPGAMAINPATGNLVVGDSAAMRINTLNPLTGEYKSSFTVEPGGVQPPDNNDGGSSGCSIGAGFPSLSSIALLVPLLLLFRK